MAEPSSTGSMQSFGGRPFAFYPAIRNVEYNEWAYRRETWSEVLVANSRTGTEVWIPRNLIDRVSTADEPVLIVGLKRELELKAGAVWPYERRLIEMPEPPRPGTRVAAPAPPHAPQAPPVPSPDSMMGRLIAYALLVAFGVGLLVIAFASGGVPRPLEWLRRREVATADQKYLSLTREDTYHDVLRKLGPPGREQWVTPESAEVHIRAMWYPERSYVIVLMGAERPGARYIGTLHAASRATLDAVPLPGGGSTAAMLRNLPKF
jgi:hypothetical protein